MKLDILGTKYDLIIRDPKDDPQLTESCDGYTDNTVSYTTFRFQTLVEQKRARRLSDLYIYRVCEEISVNQDFL